MTAVECSQTWGSNVCPGHYAGHPGVLYQPHPRTLAELLTVARRWADRTFLVQGDRRISFADFGRAIPAARRYLGDMGIGRGDRVMVFAYNSPEWALALWSLWMAGAIPVLGNRWWSPPEFENAVELLGLAHVLSDTGLPDSMTVPVSEIATSQGSSDLPVRAPRRTNRRSRTNLR